MSTGDEVGFVMIRFKEFVVMWFDAYQSVKAEEADQGAHVEGGYVHLNVHHDPLVLFHVDSPDAVLAFIIGFRPVRRQHHSG